MDYSKAKIYQLVNDITDDIYVGSTCQKLSKRMAEHRASMRSSRDNHIKLYQKMNEIGLEHFRIELIKECPCENIEQLRAIEGKYIREIGTLNSHLAGRTSSDYKKELKERYIYQHTKITEKTTEIYKMKRTEYITMKRAKQYVLSIDSVTMK